MTAPTHGPARSRRTGPTGSRHDQRGDDVRGGEERREMRARISWTSRSGELSSRPRVAARPADSPPGSRAEIKRL